MRRTIRTVLGLLSLLAGLGWPLAGSAQGFAANYSLRLPEFRVTASQLSALINGFATILLFAFIDPQLSVMTDDAVEGKVDEGDFRRAITFISLSRLAGTVLAQALLLPAATLIAYVSVHV